MRGEATVALSDIIPLCCRSASSSTGSDSKLRMAYKDRQDLSAKVGGRLVLLMSVP